MANSNQVSISPDQVKLNYGFSPTTETLNVTNKLLQRNHDDLHIFFRDLNGHNHIAHNLLTRLALGASPSELQTAFDDDLPTQRGMPQLHDHVVQKLKDESFFLEMMKDGSQYANFLAFFEQEINNKGWREVVNEYVFSRSKIANTLLPLMYDGAYHAIIHLGLGVEFQLPSIIAEALAQAAAHQSFDTDWFFYRGEELALGREEPTTTSLLDLAGKIADNDAICRAGRTVGPIGTMKQKLCIYPQVGEDLLSIVSQWRVNEDSLEHKIAEMISFCSLMAGAAQRPGKATKIDFFFMHCVTSSFFFTIFATQPWVSTEAKIRLVEWKGRMDLLWYATCGVPHLEINEIRNYSGHPSESMDWEALIRAVNEQHDDGHVAKFVRALLRGAEVARRITEGRPHTPAPISISLKGEDWLRLARMSYDTTLDLSGPAKWVLMAGIDKAWDEVPDQA
ncbi:hypothetical protein F5Y14DRAFT_407086 [Nemania sp. NC0429]|nr:hypothetical protein F5Y14DRAFT_407086 [Nemania sp. NC0429]